MLFLLRLGFVDMELILWQFIFETIKHLLRVNTEECDPHSRLGSHNGRGGSMAPVFIACKRVIRDKK